MRSVKVDRKPRNAPRAKTARNVPRPGRDFPGVQPGAARRGKEQRPGLLRRIFSRPMLMLTATLVGATMVAGLLVSGAVGRAAHGVDTAIGTTMKDAGFDIHNLHITGTRRTPQKTITAALDLKVGQSIFAADLSAARVRLMALDWIASAEVVRRYPDSIFVTLVEKRPFALWQMPDVKGEAGPIAVVERAGKVITTRDVESFARLPKLVGAGAPAAAADLVEAVRTHRAISARIAAYERVSQRRWNLIFADGVTVKLPEAGWQKELDALEYLIIDKGILERDVTEIDLRSPSHYFFMLKNGDKKDVERGKDT